MYGCGFINQGIFCERPPVSRRVGETLVSWMTSDAEISGEFKKWTE